MGLFFSRWSTNLKDINQPFYFPSCNEFLFNTNIFIHQQWIHFGIFHKLALIAFFTPCLPNLFRFMFASLDSEHTTHTLTFCIFFVFVSDLNVTGRLWSLPKKISRILLVCHLQAICAHAHTIGAQIQCESMWTPLEKGQRKELSIQKKKIKIVYVINAPQRKWTPNALSPLVLVHEILTHESKRINKESISKLPCNKNTHTIYEGTVFIRLIWIEKGRPAEKLNVQLYAI